MLKYSPVGVRGAGWGLSGCEVTSFAERSVLMGLFMQLRAAKAYM